MKTRKPVPKKSLGLAASPYARLHTLLHTVRCIAQYEDALCELSHEVKRAGVLSEESRVALEGILARMPGAAYVHEVEAVAMLLDGAVAPAGLKGERRVAKKAGAGG